MEKKKFSVMVAGQRFKIITEEEDRYVIDLAAKIDARIVSLSISQGMSRERAAVLTALDFADDNEKGKRDLSEIKEQVKDYLMQIEKLSTENAAMQSELSRARLDNEALESARKALSECNREKDALKEQIKKLKEQIALMQNEAKKAASNDEKKPAEKPAPAENTEPVKETADAVTAEDDLFFDVPEEPVKPQKEKKNKHQHNHENPYRQQYMKKQDEQKGYSQQRQYSLFDELDE
jgi:hypothetical protein